MICPICKEENLISTIELGLAHTTYAGFPAFYDELGRYHHHDDNSKIRNCKCSNGHEFRYRTQNECWCGWIGQKEEYFI